MYMTEFVDCRVETVVYQVEYCCFGVYISQLRICHNLLVDYCVPSLWVIWKSLNSEIIILLKNKRVSVDINSYLLAIHLILLMIMGKFGSSTYREYIVYFVCYYSVLFF